MISRRLAAILAAALVIVLLGAALVFSVQQSHLVRASQHQQDAEHARDEALAERDAARGDVQVVVRYVDRVQIVREAGATIVKEIPIHVTPNADRSCAVPVGFVRVHDAAAANQPVAESPGDPDALAPAATLSAIAATVVDNYTTCHAIREQLIGLQDYVQQRQVRADD